MLTRKHVAAAALMVMAAATVFTGWKRKASEKSAFLDRLFAADDAAVFPSVSFADLDTLPLPVARYFRYSLRDGQPLIQSARYRQTGTLRTGIHTARWFDFEATQHVAPPAHAFMWDAKVFLFPLVFLEVRDGYLSGRGFGKVNLFSAITVGEETGGTEMNSGALHRYLAEAVWYPTALLPASGVQWSVIDDHRALATLSDSGTTVSLEFAFGYSGEITGIFTPGRWGKFGKEFRKAAWEGHFANYEVRAGMRIPMQGEVGWHEGGRWHAVWKGRLLDFACQFH